MRQLPRPARAYIWTVWVVGGAALTQAALTLATDARSQGPDALFALLLPGALFAALAALADLKQLRLRGANYSVATATNFACAILLGAGAATVVGALGALAGDLLRRKPPHKAAFNTAAIALSVGGAAAAMNAVRADLAAPLPRDLPAFGLYAAVHVVVNQLLVCTVIALASRERLTAVISANYRGVVIPIVALYPLGLLMGVVYHAFAGWVGLLLLVLPAIAAYAALEHARQLRQANEELRAAQAALVEQERLTALGQMASGIAHDFNNALAPVVGFSELLLLQPERWSDAAYMRRYLELIHTSGQDAAQVVRQLREFYRKADAQEALLPLDVSGLARQVVDITEPRWRGQALAAGATIRVAADVQAVPPVPGDESALREALTNLIFNAVDAMPNGGAITIRTAPRGTDVLVEVADTGTGMTEDVRRRALEPFFTTKGAGGTGLGLSMVHGIVRRHGGSLEIDTAWGRGTTVRLVLPGCASQQPAASPTGAPPAMPELAEVEAPPSRPLRVLVVDDEASVRDVLTAYLSSYGYETETAVNGHDGLLRFRAAGPRGATGFDVVLTDRAMPEMNGDQLARAVKQLDATVPVVMLTGFGDMINALGETPVGVDEVLAKPVRHAALRETLSRLTAGHVLN